MNISNFPYELARRAAAVLGSKLEVSIILREHGVSLHAGSSTGAAARCDQAESLAATGPCVDSIDRRSVQVVPLISEGQGWDAWRVQSLREGFVSALAVPAFVDENVAVAVNLYSRSPNPWTRELVTAADGYAQLTASMVLLHLKLADLEDTTAGLYRQMSDESATERAIGAIMHTNDCSEHQARRILESASRQRNVPQREVAETILRALIVNDTAESDDARDH